MVMWPTPSRTLHFIGVDVLTGRNIFTEKERDGYWFDFGERADEPPAVETLTCPDGFVPPEFPPLVVGQPLGEYLELLRGGLTALFGRELQQRGNLSYKEAAVLAQGFALVPRLDREPVMMACFYFLRATNGSWNSLVQAVNS